METCKNMRWPDFHTTSVLSVKILTLEASKNVETTLKPKTPSKLKTSSVVNVRTLPLEVKTIAKHTAKITLSSNVDTAVRLHNGSVLEQPISANRAIEKQGETKSSLVQENGRIVN